MADQSTEEILVLYGSQTGNSEGAAQEIASLIPTKLLSKSNCKLFTSRCIHLDDFLEVEKAKWTRLVIIVCSSYGVGQAPIGARKFRELCDEILEQQQQQQQQQQSSLDDDNNNSNSATTTTTTNNNNNMKSMLNGIHFALLGLGDSHYATYFQNPTTIHKALTAAGATHVGSLGKADASGTGHDEQSKVIDRWIDTIWDDLNKVVNNSSNSASSSSSSSLSHSVDGLKKAREETWEMCLRIFPEWKPKTNYMSLVVSILPLVAIILAILAQWYMGII